MKRAHNDVLYHLHTKRRNVKQTKRTEYTFLSSCVFGVDTWLRHDVCSRHKRQQHISALRERHDSALLHYAIEHDNAFQQFMFSKDYVSSNDKRHANIIENTKKHGNSNYFPSRSVTYLTPFSHASSNSMQVSSNNDNINISLSSFTRFAMKRSVVSSAKSRDKPALPSQTIHSKEIQCLNDSSLHLTTPQRDALLAALSPTTNNKSTCIMEHQKHNLIPTQLHEHHPLLDIPNVSTSSLLRTPTVHMMETSQLSSTSPHVNTPHYMNDDVFDVAQSILTPHDQHDQHCVAMQTDSDKPIHSLLSTVPRAAHRSFG